MSAKPQTLQAFVQSLFVDKVLGLKVRHSVRGVGVVTKLSAHMARVEYEDSKKWSWEEMTDLVVVR